MSYLEEDELPFTGVDSHQFDKSDNHKISHDPYRIALSRKPLDLSLICKNRKNS